VAYDGYKDVIFVVSLDSRNLDNGVESASALRRLGERRVETKRRLLQRPDPETHVANRRVCNFCKL